jgi:imidazolonepropionase-like amidohydrolase
MRKLVILLLTALFGLAACGSDSKTENASDTGDAVTTEVPDSKGGADAYCGLATKYSGLEKAFTPGADAATLKSSLETAKNALDDAVKVAPSEIKADVKVIANAYGPFIEAMAKANFDFTKVNPQDPAFADIQKPEVAEAAQRIEAWGKAHCGASAG